MAVPDEPSVSSDIVASWEGGYRCRVAVRGFELIADEPEKHGGTDTGPMPTEIFLSSLASCFALAVAHAARKRGIELPDLSVRVRGEYAGLKYGKIRIEAHSSYPREEMERLVERAINYCYVSGTLRHQPDLEFVAVGASDTSLSHESIPPRD